jgi:hypothetical protein
VLPLLQDHARRTSPCCRTTRAIWGEGGGGGNVHRRACCRLCPSKTTGRGDGVAIAPCPPACEPTATARWKSARKRLMLLPPPDGNQQHVGHGKARALLVIRVSDREAVASVAVSGSELGCAPGEHSKTYLRQRMPTRRGVTRTHLEEGAEVPPACLAPRWRVQSPPRTRNPREPLEHNRPRSSCTSTPA